MPPKAKKPDVSKKTDSKKKEKIIEVSYRIINCFFLYFLLGDPPPLQTSNSDLSRIVDCFWLNESVSFTCVFIYIYLFSLLMCRYLSIFLRNYYGMAFFRHLLTNASGLFRME